MRHNQHIFNETVNEEEDLIVIERVEAKNEPVNIQLEILRNDSEAGQ